MVGDIKNDKLFPKLPLKSYLKGIIIIAIILFSTHQWFYYIYILKQLQGQYDNIDNTYDEHYKLSHSLKHHLNVIEVPINSFNLTYVEENLFLLDQSDPQLIQYARARYLSPPSKLPYGLSSNGTYVDLFGVFIANVFSFKQNGIFIEAGASDGETSSKTLYLENEYGWTGLLVECNPSVIPFLKSRHRKTWIASVCLSPTRTAGVLNFSNPTEWSYSGTLKNPWDIPEMDKDWKPFEVETVPLYTLIAAIGWKEIDYFRLDIEASELEVLKTFPFDKVIFKILITEVQFYTEEEKQELNMLLETNDYCFVRALVTDNVYVHNTAKHLFESKLKCISTFSK